MFYEIFVVFAHPEFGSSVNPIPTKGWGADYAHHITDYPPTFENLTTSLYCMFLIPNIALQMSRTLIRNDKWWLKVIIMDPGILVRPHWGH